MDVILTFLLVFIAICFLFAALMIGFTVYVIIAMVYKDMQEYAGEERFFDKGK